jgi:hypothetical protein
MYDKVKNARARIGTIVVHRVMGLRAYSRKMTANNHSLVIARGWLAALTNFKVVGNEEPLQRLFG